MSIPKKVCVIAEDWTLWETTMVRDRQFHPTTCHLVGWLIQEDRGKVVIAMEWMPSPYGDDLRHVVAIPRVNIKTMYEIIASPNVLIGKKNEKD